MWARAVWKERGREEDGVIPRSWIKDKAVYWPPGTDASKAMQKMDKPDKNWRKFVLSKVKFTSMNKEECEGYELTTAAEDNEEQLVLSRPKRVVKKRTLEDFVEDDEEETGETPSCHGHMNKSQNTISCSEADSSSEHSPLLPTVPNKYNRSMSSLMENQESISTPLLPKRFGTINEGSRQQETLPTPTRSRFTPLLPKRFRSSNEDYYQQETMTHETPTHHNRSRSTSVHRSTHGYSPSHQRSSQRRTTSMRRSSSRSTSRQRRRSRASHQRSPRESRRSRSRSTSVEMYRSRASHQTSRQERPMHQIRSRANSRSRYQASSHQSRHAFPTPLKNIRAKLSEVGLQSVSLDSVFHLEVIDSMDDLRDLNEQLKTDEKRKLMTGQMMKIGGASIRENVSNVMKRVITNKLMSGLNMDGGGGKGAFRKMTLCKVMIDSIQQSQPGASEASIVSRMAAYLRSAPDRKVGGGRKTPAADSDV